MAYAEEVPIVYDYLINLDREVGLFWTGKLTGASTLYFGTRYISMLFVIMNTVTSSPNLSPEVRGHNDLPDYPTLTLSARRGRDHLEATYIRAHPVSEHPGAILKLQSPCEGGSHRQQPTVLWACQ